jgi:hypothetical protein
MTVKPFALGVLALVSLSTVTHAQSTSAPRAPLRTDADPRWLPWLGCWEGDSTGNGLVCIVPVANSRHVDRVSIEGTTIVARDRLTADSVSRRFARDGCRGIETGEWSTTGHVLYQRAEFTCADSLEGRSTTLFAFTSNGEWIESMQLRAARGTLERATRYHDAGLSSALPKETAAALRAKRLAIATARAAASAPVASEEMAEATRIVGDDVARPWLVARGYLAESAPQRTPAPGEATVAPSAQQQMCQTVVCYSPQPYSTYNGTPTPAYPSYMYGSWGSYYGYLPMISSYWVPAPLVVIGGSSSRRPVRRDQPRDRPRDQPTIRVHDDSRAPATARPREQPRPSVQAPAMRVVQPRRR